MMAGAWLSGRPKTRLALAFAAGLVAATGFAPLHLWPVALVALAGWMGLVHSAFTRRHALALGWWFGVGHFILGLDWIATAFTYQAAMPAWLGWIAVALLSMYLAVYPMAAAGLAWRWRARRTGGADGLLFALVFASAWIVTEWLRATLFTGFAWNPLGVLWVDLPPVAWTAGLIGTYGLSGLAILVAGGLLMLLDHPYAVAPWKLIAPPIAGAALLTGAWWLAAPTPTENGPLVRIVQPNIGQQDKWDKGFERRNFQRLARLTGDPGPVPRLLLWPEAATPDYLEDEPWARARLANLIGPKDLLLTGGVAIEWGDGDRAIAARNGLFILSPEGRILGRYDKAHLVPYGEYLPMRPILSLIGLTRLAPGDLDFWAGPGPRSFALPGFGTVGVQICYEIIFSGHVVDRAHRPDFLFNPSNDAWFGRSGPPQHLAQARLRAIEEGLPVLRATPTGISAVIGADGELLHALPWQQPGVIEARLPPPRAPTPFARLGNLLPLGCAALLAAAAVARRRRKR